MDTWTKIEQEIGFQRYRLADKAFVWNFDARDREAASNEPATAHHVDCLPKI